MVAAGRLRQQQHSIDVIMEDLAAAAAAEAQSAGGLLAEACVVRLSIWSSRGRRVADRSQPDRDDITVVDFSMQFCKLLE